MDNTKAVQKLGQVKHAALTNDLWNSGEELTEEEMEGIVGGAGEIEVPWQVSLEQNVINFVFPKQLIISSDWRIDIG